MTINFTIPIYLIQIFFHLIGCWFFVFLGMEIQSEKEPHMIMGAVIFGIIFHIAGACL